MRKKIAILGIGSMGRTLTLGLATSTNKYDFSLFTPSQEKAKTLAHEIGGQHIADLAHLGHQDLILIACKPQQFQELADSIKPYLSGAEIILSIMAGVSTATISRKLSLNQVVRIMPNTPNRIGLGVNLFYFTKSISLPEKTQILESFHKFSHCFPMDSEDQIDQFTAFTGSGPGLIFEFARIFEEGLKKRGLDPIVARVIVAHTFLGSSSLMVQEKKDPMVLRSEVTSKGGVTFAALKVMQDQKFENIMELAFEQAYIRCKELGSIVNK